MAGKINEFQYEQQLREIESATIINVWYEMDEGEEISFDEKAGFHSVDRAVYLQTADQRYFRISWADDLNIHHGFGVSFKQVKLYPERNRQLVLVNLSFPWQDFLGKPVLSTRIQWELVLKNMRSPLRPLFGIGYLRRWDYPQSIELSFGQNKSLFFSSLSVDETGNISTMTNHLTIFFSAAEHNNLIAPSGEW